jgi:hypothetical protein
MVKIGLLPFLNNEVSFVSFVSKVEGEENTLPCVVAKTHDKQDLCRGA